MPKIEQSTPALDTYAAWRPRLARGVTWAGLTAALSKTLGGDARGVKHIVIPTALAGIAGVADAALEEAVRNGQIEHVQKAFDKKGGIPVPEDDSLFTSGVLDRADEGRDLMRALFASKEANRIAAQKQLSGSFPRAASRPDSWGSAIRFGAGDGVRPLLRTVLNGNRS